MQQYRIDRVSSPIIAAAIHDGHYVPSEYREFLMLTEGERFREEDPYTLDMALLPVNLIRVATSRFFVDLNRTAEKSVYLKPEDAWGLTVWKKGYPKRLREATSYFYREFYRAVETLIEATIRDFGHFFVLDIHSYNHRRQDPYHPASVSDHPEINLGTFYNPSKWTPLLKKIKGYLRNCSINGHAPDVRENVLFKGGAFAQWVIAHYGNAGAVISLEFKKTFMDEWTGRAFPDHIRDINKALKGLIPLISYELGMIN